MPLKISLFQNRKNQEEIVLAGGCFWCLEAIYQDLYGVIKVESGYSNGLFANPSYDQVCTGKTGHAEVVRLTYDTSVINLDEILTVFWTMHDPTTLNRQGNDSGTQYRSGIYFFYRKAKEKLPNIHSIQLLKKSGETI
jgi:methionine-S-sulfoxide reductase